MSKGMGGVATQNVHICATTKHKARAATASMMPTFRATQHYGMVWTVARVESSEICAVRAEGFSRTWPRWCGGSEEPEKHPGLSVLPDMVDLGERNAKIKRLVCGERSANGLCEVVEARQS